MRVGGEKAERWELDDAATVRLDVIRSFESDSQFLQDDDHHAGMLERWSFHSAVDVEHKASEILIYRPRWKRRRVLIQLFIASSRLLLPDHMLRAEPLKKNYEPCLASTGASSKRPG